MKEEHRTREQLTNELAELSQRIVELEASEAERKPAAEELRATKERLQYLVSSSPAVIYTSRPSGDYGATFISENVALKMGYEPREFIEDSGFWADHIHPEDAPRIFEELPRLFEHGHHTHEYRFLRKDGTYRWMRDETKLVRDADGNPVEIIGYWIDITERKQAEEELKRRVAELMALNTMAAIVNESLDVDEILNRAMDEALRLVGVEAAAMLLLDEEAGELVMITHRGITDEMVQAASRFKLGEGLTGQVAQTGEPAVMADLTEYPGALRAYIEKDRIRSAAVVPLIGSSGVIGTMNLATVSLHYFDAVGLELLVALGQQIAVGVEKTRLYGETRTQAEELRKHRDHLEELVEQRAAELRRANEELEAEIAERRRAEAELRIKDNAIESSLSGIAITDIEASITYVNPAFLKMWGYDDDTEILGISGTEFWQMKEKAVEVLQALQEKGMWLGELTAERRDGTSLDIQIAASMIVDEAGGPKGIIASFVDITARKRAEEALAQRVEELELFNRLAVGRELRMVELKRQVNALSEQLGKMPPYDLSLLEG